ncbi:MAG TPA: response regulator [bacterium]|nr:response regulator [bacterium]HPN30059.1 response regulator [bacterium]
MEKILIIDDDKWIAQMLIDRLDVKEYSVKHSTNGKEAFSQLETFIPDIVILDIMMPEMNGYEFLEIFRATAAFTSIPVIILSAKGKEQDIIKGFEYGADNYITKPCSPSIMLSHIKHTLSLRKKLSGLNPLSGLPGNNVISKFTNDLLAKKKQFYFCYIDLDNFKVFNDYYGFDKGDKVLLYTTDSLRKLFGADKNNFIGHIGGDDFILILQSESFETQIQCFIKEFDEGIKQFYKPNDIRSGGIIAPGRDGVKNKFEFVSLSIGIVPSINHSFHSIFQISDTAVMVKKKAKSMPGSNYYIDKRSDFDKSDFKIKLSDIKILLNEQPYSVRMIKHFLAPFNFNTIEAGGKEEILINYIKNEPDAVIVDIEIASLIDTVKKIRTHELKCSMKKSYILAVCEQLTQNDVISIIKAGVDNIITKPISNESVVNKIKEIIKLKNI